MQHDHVSKSFIMEHFMAVNVKLGNKKKYKENFTFLLRSGKKFVGTVFLFNLKQKNDFGLFDHQFDCVHSLLSTRQLH